MRNSRRLFGAVYAKPTKCPNCDNTYFSHDRTGPRGQIYWKCNKCGHEIED